jgi:hypothetical protein
LTPLVWSYTARSPSRPTSTQEGLRSPVTPGGRILHAHNTAMGQTSRAEADGVQLLHKARPPTCNGICSAEQSYCNLAVRLQLTTIAWRKAASTL